MFEYIIGKNTYANNNYLILENNYIGYKIYLNNPDKYENNTFYKIYVFIKINQNNKGNFNYEYYGFKTIYEKYFFELLMSVNGIGPKTAMNIMKNDLNLLKNLIMQNNVNELENLIGFNNKLAIAISNEIGYKLRNSTFFNKDNTNKNFENNTDCTNVNALSNIISALKALGYKKDDIEFALSNISNNLSECDENDINELISESIKIIVKKNENLTVKTS